MHWAAILAAILAVYIYRDALCVRHLRPRRTATFIYVASVLGRGVLLGMLAEHLGRDEALALLGRPVVWVSALLVHAVAGTMLHFLRRRRQVPMLAVLLLPSPMEWFAMGGAAWLGLQVAAGMEGWVVGLLAGALWAGGASVFGMVWQRDASTAWNAVTSANLTAMALLPLQLRSGPSNNAPAGGEAATLLPLLPVAALVLLGLGIQRLRRTRREPAL
jgi:hypothetical protein